VYFLFQNEAAVNSNTKLPVVWKKLFLIACTIMLVTVMVWINVYTRSARYAREGDVLFGEGKLIESIASYETSAHAYTPWNPHVRHSLDTLWEIGEALESKYEDPTYALVAYRSLRSSVYAIRSFYMPYKEWVPKCDEKIASLINIQRQLIEEGQRKRVNNRHDPTQ
jgi:hypothetical protein